MVWTLISSTHPPQPTTRTLHTPVLPAHLNPFGTSSWHYSRLPLGGRMATTIVDRYFHHYPFFCFLKKNFSVATFSHRRSARIKKLISRKLTGAPKILGVDHFQDPVGHFEAPWWPFWIFEVLIEGMIKSKNLFSKS